MKLVPATSEMVKKYCVGTKSVHAIACVEGEEVLGVAGVYLHDGKQIMFSWIGEELKKKPRMMIHAWKIVSGMAKVRNLPTFAECDQHIPKAAEFLKHCGFVPFENHIWYWRK